MVCRWCVLLALLSSPLASGLELTFGSDPSEGSLSTGAHTTNLTIIKRMLENYTNVAAQVQGGACSADRGPAPKHSEDGAGNDCRGAIDGVYDDYFKFNNDLNADTSLAEAATKTATGKEEMPNPQFGCILLPSWLYSIYSHSRKRVVYVQSWFVMSSARLFLSYFFFLNIEYMSYVQPGFDQTTPLQAAVLTSSPQQIGSTTLVQSRKQQGTAKRPGFAKTKETIAIGLVASAQVRLLLSMKGSNHLGGILKKLTMPMWRVGRHGSK